MTRRLVFLDFDGCIMTQRTYLACRELGPVPEGPGRHQEVAYRRMDLGAVQRVSELCVRAGADIVLSSAWRYRTKGATFGVGANEAVHGALRQAGLDDRVRFAGATAGLPSGYRGDEIGHWLDRRSRRYGTPRDDERILIIDDDSDLDPLKHRWVKCLWDAEPGKDGFGEEQLASALQLFGLQV